MRARERGPRVMLAQITAPHFCAGLGVDVEEPPNRVVDAAPILAYMLGWSAQSVKDYCYDKGWTVKRVTA